MARKTINIGVIGNDGTGDSIRDSFRKINDNFRELYSSLGLGDRLTFIGLDDTPETYLDQINPADPTNTPLVTINNTSDGLEFKRLVSGANISIEFTRADDPNPNQIIINSTFSEISLDTSPQLGGNLSAKSGLAQYRILDLGTTSEPLIPLVKHEAVNKAYADSKLSLAGVNAINFETGLVDSSFGRMSGPLILSRDPEPNDDEIYDGLIAATKQYVDTRAITLGSTTVTLNTTVNTITGLSSVTSNTFVGPLTGNASSSTVASTVVLTSTSTTNATHYITFVDSATGNENVRTDIDLIYNPSTNILTAGGFSGSGAFLTGIPNAALNNSSVTVGTTVFSLGSSSTTLAGLTSVTSTTFVGALTGNANTASTAAVGTTVTLTQTDSTNAVHYLLFSNALTGNEDVRTDSGITYNPSTNTLSTTTFSGALSGNATTATTASKSTTVTLVPTNTTNAVHYVTFVDSVSGDEEVRTDTDITYNPNTGILSAPTFFGALVGNAQTASTAAVANSVALTQTDNPASAVYYPTFVANASGNEIVRTDIGMTYNPSTNSLTTTTFVGSLNGNANTATTAGTVTTAAQPAITSVGTLTGLTVGGTTSIQQILEKITVTATAIPNNTFIDILSGAIVYYTVNADSNWSLNFRGNSGTLLNNVMAIGQSLTVAVMVTNGTTPYYPLDHIIDGTSVTVKWENGIPISAGNADGVDIYSYTIIKTANNTYTVFGSQTKFA